MIFLPTDPNILLQISSKGIYQVQTNLSVQTVQTLICATALPENPNLPSVSAFAES